MEKNNKLGTKLLVLSVLSAFYPAVFADDDDILEVIVPSSNADIAESTDRNVAKHFTDDADQKTIISVPEQPSKQDEDAKRITVTETSNLDDLVQPNELVTKNFIEDFLQGRKLQNGEIILGDTIGEGGFGTVSTADQNGSALIVKQPKNGKSTNAMQDEYNRSKAVVKSINQFANNPKNLNIFGALLGSGSIVPVIGQTADGGIVQEHANGVNLLEAVELAQSSLSEKINNIVDKVLEGVIDNHTKEILKLLIEEIAREKLSNLDEITKQKEGIDKLAETMTSALTTELDDETKNSLGISINSAVQAKLVDMINNNLTEAQYSQPIDTERRKTILGSINTSIHSTIAEELVPQIEAILSDSGDLSQVVDAAINEKRRGMEDALIEKHLIDTIKTLRKEELRQINFDSIQIPLATLAENVIWTTINYQAPLLHSASEDEIIQITQGEQVMFSIRQKLVEYSLDLLIERKLANIVTSFEWDNLVNTRKDLLMFEDLMRADLIKEGFTSEADNAVKEVFWEKRTTIQKLVDKVNTTIIESFDGFFNAQGFPKNPQKAIQALCSFFHALVTLHALGYVHCDIKVENVILTQDHTLKLIDLGGLTPICHNITAHSCSGTPETLYANLLGIPQIPTAQPAYDIYCSTGVILGCLFGDAGIETDTEYFWPNIDDTEPWKPNIIRSAQSKRVIHSKFKQHQRRISRTQINNKRLKNLKEAPIYVQRISNVAFRNNQNGCRAKFWRNILNFLNRGQYPQKVLSTIQKILMGATEFDPNNRLSAVDILEMLQELALSKWNDTTRPEEERYTIDTRPIMKKQTLDPEDDPRTVPQQQQY